MYTCIQMIMDSVYNTIIYNVSLWMKCDDASRGNALNDNNEGMCDSIKQLSYRLTVGESNPNLGKSKPRISNCPTPSEPCNILLLNPL